MIRIKKVVLRLWTGLFRTFLRRPSTNQVLLTILTFIAFTILLVEPRMKSGDYSWFDPSAWIIIAKTSIPVILAGLFIKYTEKFKHYRPKTFNENYEWIARRTKISRIVAELGKSHDLVYCQSNQEEMRRLREWTLECVASSTREYLQLPNNEIITATLVDILGPAYTRADKNSMFVSARTAKGLQVGHTKKKSKLVAFEAIKKNDMAICHDTKRDKRWGKQTVSYRSVVAVPITVNHQACGSLCIETTKPYGFMGKTRQLNSLVQPFLSLLALTFPTDCVYLECDYDTKHPA